MFKKGTVVLVPFPFTDLSSQKVRPGIIVSQMDIGEDVIVAFISSHQQKKLHPTDILIKHTERTFRKTGLKTDSIVKPNKLATLDKKIVLGELGSIDASLKKIIDNKLKKLFGL